MTVEEFCASTFLDSRSYAEAALSRRSVAVAAPNARQRLRAQPPVGRLLKEHPNGKVAQRSTTGHMDVGRQCRIQFSAQRHASVAEHPSSDLPVIVLSARDREAEKIAALDLGADDYVNKPFAVGELLARIRSALRRRKLVATELPTQYRVGRVTNDTGTHQVRLDDAIVHLTPKEFHLLLMLTRYAGRVVTHRQILTEVWGPAHGADTQYLRVFIGQLRQKLEDDPAMPKLILIEPGIGYRIAEAS